MEREIRFRGKRIDNRGWIYGYLVGDRGKGKYIVEGVGTGAVEVVAKTVGQFLGLQDKDGVDIWENDILSDGEDKYRVWIEPGKMLIGGIEKEWDEYLTASSYLNRLSVIGNIYSNPELTAK